MTYLYFYFSVWTCKFVQFHSSVSQDRRPRVLVENQGNWSTRLGLRQIRVARCSWGIELPLRGRDMLRCKLFIRIQFAFIHCKVTRYKSLISNQLVIRPLNFNFKRMYLRIFWYAFRVSFLGPRALLNNKFECNQIRRLKISRENRSTYVTEANCNKKSLLR